MFHVMMSKIREYLQSCIASVCRFGHENTLYIMIPPKARKFLKPKERVRLEVLKVDENEIVLKISKLERKNIIEK